MKENTNQDKKKVTIALVMGISLLLILVIGSTFAYFLVNTSNNSTPSTLNVKTPNLGLATLKGGITNLKLNVSATDMVEEKANLSYFADDSENYITDIEEGTHTIGTIEITDGDEDINYKCNANVTITIDGNMIDKIKEGDYELYLNTGNLVKKVDLSTLKDSKTVTYNPEFIIEGNGSEEFKAYVKLNNKNENQNDFAGSEMSINIKTSNIECNAFDETEILKKLRKDDSNNTISAKLSGGMYRYQGSAEKVTSNYICFGTSDKTECTEDEDHHMYRIIGIMPDGSLKVIKKTVLENKRYMWNGNYSVDIKWPESMIYTAINGEDFLNNSEYFTDQWQSKIVDTTWKYGSMASDNINNTGIELYQIESGKKLTTYDEIASSEDKNAKSMVMSNGDNIGSNIYYFSRKDYWTDEVTSKISAMYYHDYVLSISDTANCEFNNNYEICKNGWLHHTNNVSSDFLKNSEFTISYYNLFPEWGRFFSNGIMDTGSNSVNWFISQLIVRPVFYITNNIKLSGTGTTIDPYIINFN